MQLHSTPRHTVPTPGRCERNTCRRQATNQTIAEVANTKGPPICCRCCRCCCCWANNRNRMNQSQAVNTRNNNNEEGRVRNGNKVALNCERLMRQEFHRYRFPQRQRGTPSATGWCQVSDVKCQSNGQKFNGAFSSFAAAFQSTNCRHQSRLRVVATLATN